LISMMCLGVFAGLQQITFSMMNVAIRDEAYHLMQAEAERLLSTDFGSANATATDQTITSSVKTSYMPTTLAQFAIASDNNLGRITFARRVVSVSSSFSAKTLRVEVEWTWKGRSNLISTPIYRTL